MQDCGSCLGRTEECRANAVSILHDIIKKFSRNLMKTISDSFQLLFHAVLKGCEIAVLISAMLRDCKIRVIFKVKKFNCRVKAETYVQS